MSPTALSQAVPVPGGGGNVGIVPPPGGGVSPAVPLTVACVEPWEEADGEVGAPPQNVEAAAHPTINVSPSTRWELSIFSDEHSRPRDGRPITCYRNSAPCDAQFQY